ncbi:MAG TPA: pyruvate kinase, partial [Acidaminococcaceae bacterium]|nr:pyruvate kinase [Acidaminococcaceae bacterium]
MKKTKIVCTMGPATDSPTLLYDMINAGMDMARFNFSHGDYASHRKRIELVREAAAKADRPIALICDTKGPEMRLGEFSQGPVLLKTGDTFTLTTEKADGTDAIAHVDYAGLPGEVRPGNRILLADGMLILEVEFVDGARIVTKVISGGELS